MLTKVKLRQKPLADGRLSLYLDFYPPITDQVTGKKTRREFLQLHIWEKPKGSLQRQHNADTLFVAEQIRFERENALLKSNIYSDLEKEHIAYLERSEKKFIEYYEESFKDKPLANWYRYSGAFYLLKKFCPKDIKFKDITLKWCENFRSFVLRADSLFHEGKTLAQTTRHNYFRCFRTILLQAFNEGYLRENLNAKLECIPRKDRPRQFLSVSELNQLIQTPCSKENLKRAALFSALTGLRFGDIQALTWISPAKATTSTSQCEKPEASCVCRYQSKQLNSWDQEGNMANMYSQDSAETRYIEKHSENGSMTQGYKSTSASTASATPLQPTSSRPEPTSQQSAKCSATATSRQR